MSWRQTRKEICIELTHLMPLLPAPWANASDCKLSGSESKVGLLGAGSLFTRPSLEIKWLFILPFLVGFSRPSCHGGATGFLLRVYCLCCCLRDRHPIYFCLPAVFALLVEFSLLPAGALDGLPLLCGFHGKEEYHRGRA
jgi:hypothetical protein